MRRKRDARLAIPTSRIPEADGAADVSKGNLGLLRGTLDLLILNALSTGEKHGYAVSEWIETVSDGSLLVEEGTLYPALHRLERRRLIEATWGVSQNNRRAKYYALTAAGWEQHATEAETWRRYSAAVEKTLSEGSAG